MHFLGILVLTLCHLSRGFPVPVDTIIVQIQQWGVAGAQQVMKQVLLNGVCLTSTNQDVTNIVQTMSADAFLPALISTSQTSALKNHVILRSQECILEGSQLHWTDRVFYDGQVYLTLDHNDTWTAHEPQALALKVLWDQEEHHARTERIRLQEGCIKLMSKIRLSEERSVPGLAVPQFLILVLVLLAFTGIIIVSLLLSKNQGLRHPGGVIGSIVHYPKDMTDMAPEMKGSGYHTL
ncbi:uncharacterized protein [Brachyistius frenatus]|uniref:uncharacterized protein isoform X1 n=1 Tax=Brachyistius frenatus TaxID=100188 RepID=UPI0037E984A6